jgi:molybdopterin synthase sulfur carrier subunit
VGAVVVRFYAGAADAAGCKEESLSAETVGALRAALLDRHDDRFARVLAASTVLIDGERVSTDDRRLPDGDVVEILPPYSGG